MGCNGQPMAGFLATARGHVPCPQVLAAHYHAHVVLTDRGPFQWLHSSAEEGQIKQMLQDKLLMELCHDNKTEI